MGEVEGNIDEKSHDVTFLRFGKFLVGEGRTGKTEELQSFRTAIPTSHNHSYHLTMKLLALIPFLPFLALARADNAKGPSVFIYEDKAYLKVTPAMTVNIFQRVNGKPKLQDEIVLNGPASEFSATADKEANATRMEVNFKWDGVDFKGNKDKTTTLTSLSAKLTFTRELREYSLTSGDVNATIAGTEVKNKLQAHAENGNVVSAPMGSSYCCSNL